MGVTSSQAAPAVSGIAAITLATQNSITNREFMQILIETSDDLGDTDYDTEYGYGLINGKKLIDRILDNIRYYVSPINIDNDTAYVLIKNNTEDILATNSIFANYNDRHLQNCELRSITLLPNKSLIIKTTNANSITHFLWSDTSNMLPLADKREVKTE